MAIPKLALIPAAHGNKFYSVLPSDGVGDFTFTRGSSATRINAEGLIETVANTSSRLNYDLLNGKVVDCPHYLLEPARTNVTTYSEDFSNSAWIKSDVTISANATISPDGQLNAYKITDNTNNARHRLSDSVTLSSSTAKFTSSVFLKQGTHRYAFLNTSSSGSNAYTIVVDLQTGIKTAETENGTDNDFEVRYFGNGWYRLSVTIVAASATAFIQFGTAGSATPTYNNFIPTYAGSSEHIFGFGSQVEVGTYLTSYIPTSGSAVTRAAEASNSSGNSELFNDSEGVLFAEISALYNDGTYRALALSNGTSNERIYIEYTNASNTVAVVVKNGGSTQANMSFGLTDETDFSKIAIKYKANDFALWVNGVKRQTDNSGSVPSGLSELAFDDGVGNNDFYGKCKDLRVYNEALTDAQLQTLTSL